MGKQPSNVENNPMGTSFESRTHTLKIEERRNKILETLERDGQVRVSSLAQMLSTTVVTIRSDLDALEQDGLVERVPGGAVLTTMSLYNQEFLRRKRTNTEDKRALATAALDEVEDGDTLFMNGGSTTYFAALMLKRMKKNLIVVTNSLSIATELGMAPTFTVLLVGGQVNSCYSFTCGSEALNQLSKYQVSKAIISIDGVDGSGITTIHPEESSIALKMIERAGTSIVLADASKIGKDGFCTICGVNQIDLLITNESADPEALAQIQESGVQIKVV